MSYPKFEDLVGKTITDIREEDDGERMYIDCSDDSHYVMFHSQDCCERVSIEDICGDLNDLIGSPVLMAEESSSEEPPEGCSHDERPEWTFYRLSTIKGSVVIRWFGQSDYYSTSVTFAAA
jgi:hypothetical protein